MTDIIPRRKRVFIVGATGTIGRATVHALVARGYDVVCFVRRGAGARDLDGAGGNPAQFAGAQVRTGNVMDMESLARDGFCGEHFDAVISCLASRTGAPADAWNVDHRAQLNVLSAAQQSGVSHFVLLSAICVQKPQLAFQHAKLAFERELVESGLTYSIVRPTAFFKSLSGQIARVKQGKPFLVFGDGTITACKPISDRDTADYLVTCLDDVSLHNRVLPIGGPGAAITPIEQGEQLFTLLGTPARFKHVPVALLDGIIRVLGTAGRVIRPLEDKAELARIGRYYATESMLLWDATTSQYDARATPTTGSDTLFDYYAQVITGAAAVERGDHAVF